MNERPRAGKTDEDEAERKGEKARQRLASYTIWPLTGGWLGHQGVEIEMKTGRYPKPCRVFAMVVNEGY